MRDNFDSAISSSGSGKVLKDVPLQGDIDNRRPMSQQNKWKEFQVVSSLSTS